MRNDLLAAGTFVLVLDAGFAHAQMSAPVLQSDGGASTQIVNGTISLPGTLTANPTFGNGLTVKSGSTAAFNATVNINSGFTENWVKATGSTAQTIAGTGGGIVLEGTITSVVDSTAETLGRIECIENEEASTTVTVTTTTGSFILTGSASTVSSFTLATGAGKCFFSDGTNHVERSS
jgi:hypothetical protein